jgi:hypothetical protein
MSQPLKPPSIRADAYRSDTRVFSCYDAEKPTVRTPSNNRSDCTDPAAWAGRTRQAMSLHQIQLATAS